MSSPVEVSDIPVASKGHAAVGGSLEVLWPTSSSPEEHLKHLVAKQLLTGGPTTGGSRSIPLSALEAQLKSSAGEQLSSCTHPLSQLLSADDHFDIRTTSGEPTVRVKAEYLHQSAAVIKQIEAVWPPQTGLDNAAKALLAKHLVYHRDPSVAKYSMPLAEACTLLKAHLPELKISTNKNQLKTLLYNDHFLSMVYPGKGDGLVKLKVPRLLNVTVGRPIPSRPGSAPSTPSPVSSTTTPRPGFATSKQNGGSASAPSTSTASTTNNSSVASSPRSLSSSSQLALDEINAAIDKVWPPGSNQDNDMKAMCAKRLAAEANAASGSHSMPLANIGNLLKEQARENWSICKGGLRFIFMNDPHFDLDRWNTNWKVSLKVDTLLATAASKPSPLPPSSTASSTRDASPIPNGPSPTSSHADNLKPPPGFQPNPARPAAAGPTAPSYPNRRPGGPGPAHQPPQPTPRAAATAAPAAVAPAGAAAPPFHNSSVVALPKDAAQLIDQEWPTTAGQDSEHKNYVAKVLVSKGEAAAGHYSMTLAKLGQHLRRIPGEVKLKEALMRDDRFEVLHTSVTEVVVRLLTTKFRSGNGGVLSPGGSDARNLPDTSPTAAPPTPAQQEAPAVKGAKGKAAAGGLHGKGGNGGPLAAAAAAAPPALGSEKSGASAASGGATGVPVGELYQKLFHGKGGRSAGGTPEWRYKDHSGNQGPISPDQIIRLCEQRRINDDTPICGCSGEVKHPNLPGSKFYKPLSTLLQLVAGGASYELVTKADVKRAKPNPGWNEPKGGAVAIATGPAAGKSPAAGPGGPPTQQQQQRTGPAARLRPDGPGAGRPGPQAGRGAHHLGPDGPGAFQHGPHNGPQQRGPGPMGGRGPGGPRMGPGEHNGFGPRQLMPRNGMEQQGKQGGQGGPGGLQAHALPFVPGQSLHKHLDTPPRQGQGGWPGGAGSPGPFGMQQPHMLQQHPQFGGMAPGGGEGLMPRGGQQQQPGSPGTPGSRLPANLDVTHGPAGSPTPMQQQQQLPPQSLGAGINVSAAALASQGMSPPGPEMASRPMQMQGLQQGADMLGARPLLQPRTSMPQLGLAPQNLQSLQQLNQQLQQLQMHHQHIAAQQRQQQQAQQAQQAAVLSRMQQEQLLHMGAQRELSLQLFAHGKVVPAEQPNWWFADQAAQVYGPFPAGQMIKWFLDGIIKEDLRVCSSTADVQQPLTPPVQRFRSVGELLVLMSKGVFVPPVQLAELAAAYQMMLTAAAAAQHQLQQQQQQQHQQHHQQQQHHQHQQAHQQAHQHQQHQQAQQQQHHQHQHHQHPQHHQQQPQQQLQHQPAGMPGPEAAPPSLLAAGHGLSPMLHAMPAPQQHPLM